MSLHANWLARTIVAFAPGLVAFAAAPLRASPPPVAAQSQPQLAARLSTGVVKLGGDLRLVVEIEGVQQAAIRALPEVDGLRFGPVGAPGLNESISIINGRQTRSRKLSWVVQIQPLRKGEFSIPPITVEYDGRSAQTRELFLKVVEDMQGEELGLFEIDAPDQVFEGQPFTLEMRFGWDAALSQGLNYANLSLPWLGELSGILELDLGQSSTNGPWVELTLNSRDRIRAEQIASKTVQGRTFQLLRVKKRYIAARAGTLEFPTSHLEFGQVSEGGIFSARPSEKRTYYKRFPGFEIQVLKLPEEGRPIDFTGAVGSIHASATADRRDVDAGDSIKFSVEWTGDANLEFFEPPDPARMDGFKGFRVYGSSDRKSVERRVVIYDLAPISAEVREIPPLGLRVFDPVKKAYTIVATDSIPIRVRSLAKGSSLASETGRDTPALDIRDIQTLALGETAIARPGALALGAAAGAVPLGWLLLRTLVRRRGDPAAPQARARRRARKMLARDLAHADSAVEQARAFQRFLARRTGESEQAWVGRDALAWARAEHERFPLSPDEARSLADVLAELDERVYAGGALSGNSGDRAASRLDDSRLTEAADRLIRGGL